MTMNRILASFNRLFAVWVILGGCCAFLYPSLFLPLKNYMDYYFGVTMFGIGMVLNPQEFVNILRNFKIVLIGFTAQYTIMPGLAFLIAKVFAFPGDFTLGLILTGSAPEAMSSNLISYLAGADAAYAISLTTFSTLLAPLVTPALTFLLAHANLEISFWEMFFSIFKMVIIPLFLGIILKRALKEKLESMEKIFPAISTLFIVLICSLIIALNKKYLSQIDSRIFVACLLLNLLGLVLGYWVGVMSRFTLARTRALAIEVGMQNAGLGSVLAIKHFNEKTAIPAVIFIFICIFTASLLASYWSRNPLQAPDARTR